MKLKTILAPLLLLLSVSPASSQDPCAPSLPAQTLDDFVLQLSTKVSDNHNAAKQGAAEGKEATKNELATRTNGDGLTSSRLDLLKRAFLAFDLGQLEEKDEKLIFNFNPDAFNSDLLGGQFSPRIIVNRPALFKALEQKIDTLSEEVRQSRKDALKKGMGDLDNVEAHVRWTYESGTPRVALQKVANEIYEQVDVFSSLAEEIPNQVALISREFPNSNGPLLLSEVCADPEAKKHLLKLVSDITDKGAKALDNLEEALEEEGFFKLADLIEGEPRFSAEGVLQRRRGAAGPDERSLNVRFERGSVSYRGFKKWAVRQGKEVNIASINEYLAGKAERFVPNWVVNFDYVKTSDFKIPLPLDATEFVQAESRKISFSGTGGVYLGGTRDRRVELKATYDDVTDDPKLNDRLVFTLDWIHKLNPTLGQALGASDWVVTLIYADKPEFRGEVNQELSLRAGIKWKLGGTTEK
jgi:hypothetical protein